MVSDQAFDAWCRHHHLSEQARALVERIRSSPPSRLVRGAAGNVSGRYPSKKMGCTIQFESHRGELAFIYQLEHDPAVFEFFDQPESIKLVYPGKTGKPVGLFHTADFFIIREEGAGWVECKMEDHLLHLADHMPHRYVRNGEGTWSCPPGEAYAQPFGLWYRVQSSAQIDWVYQRNLRFLEDYVRVSRPPLKAEVTTAIRALVMGKPDDVYFLIATEQLYVDFTSRRLPWPIHSTCPSLWTANKRLPTSRSVNPPGTCFPLRRSVP